MIFRNESPLGYLFNQACDNVAVIFIIITMAMLMGFDPDIESDARCIWYSVISGKGHWRSTDEKHHNTVHCL